MYVCAFGSTPIAAVLVFKGLSPGAALAFLIAGSATNLASLRSLSEGYGRPLAWRFAIAMVVLAVAAGAVVDLLVDPRSLPTDLGSIGQGAWEAACLALVGSLGLLSLFRQGAEGFVAQIVGRHGHRVRDHCPECAHEHAGQHHEHTH